MDIRVSAFSNVKKSQLRKWFEGSAYSRLSVLLLYGPSGTGKKSSLRLLLNDLNMQSDELDIDKPRPNLASILRDAYTCTAETIVAPLSFNELSDISQFFESFEEVGPVPPRQKRVIFIISSDTLPTPLPYLQTFSLSTIHIPRTTDRTITNILRRHMQDDVSLAGSSVRSSIDVEEIARQAHGDIRHAFHQMRWLRMNGGPLSSKNASNVGRDMLHLHPDHVSLKLLCGKEEYRAVSSLDFLDNVNRHFLIDSLFKNLLRYFSPSDTESLSKALDSLSMIDTFGYSATAESNSGIYIFLSAYRNFNPDPMKNDVFTTQSNTRSKRAFGEPHEHNSFHGDKDSSLSPIESQLMFPYEVTNQSSQTIYSNDARCRPLSDDDIE